jgi:hypothetical protein
MSTFIKIQTITVGSGGAASIDFTSIPATYTDLKVVCSVQGSIANTTINMQFNGSTTGYTSKYLRGSGTAANSYDQTGFGANWITGTYLVGSGSAFTSQEFYIPNYLSSNYKSASGEGVDERNSAAAYAMLDAGLWSNTAAINQLSLLVDSGLFAQYSSATLYGIKSS